MVGGSVGLEKLSNKGVYLLSTFLGIFGPAGRGGNGAGLFILVSVSISAKGLINSGCVVKDD